MDTRRLDTVEYPLHKSARVALYIVSALLVLLCVTIPIAIWIAVRTAGGKVVVSPTGVVAKGLLTSEFAYADVARLGTCKVAIIARGVGGALAKQRVGGDNAIHVVVKLKDGKTRKFIASSYEKYQEIMAKISERVGRPYEELSMGAFGMKLEAIVNFRRVPIDRGPEQVSGSTEQSTNLAAIETRRFSVRVSTRTTCRVPCMTPIFALVRLRSSPRYWMAVLRPVSPRKMSIRGRRSCSWRMSHGGHSRCMVGQFGSARRAGSFAVVCLNTSTKRK